MGTVKEIAAYLAQPSIVGPIVSTYKLPEATDGSKDRVLCVRPFGGAGPEFGLGNPGIRREMPAIQILTRGIPFDSDEPETRIQKAFQALPKIQGMLVGGVYYEMIWPQQSPFVFENDAKNRVVWICNFVIKKDVSPP